MERQSGLSEVVYSISGREVVHYCRSVAIWGPERVYVVRPSLRTFSICENQYQLWSCTITSTSRMPLNATPGTCWDLLSQLHKTCRDGSEQPSEAALARCLENMHDLPGQIPTHIIVDALDECPNTTGTPSTLYHQSPRARHINPLTSQSRRVSLHEEGGQREAINCHVRSLVLNDKNKRR